MKTLNIGMAGSGFMGKTHTYAYTAIPFYYPSLPYKINLKTVYSRSYENALKLSALGYVKATCDFDELINDREIDIINICTPNSCHFESVLKAIKAGKHVYCEKPLAASSAEAKILAEEAERQDKICQVVFHNRFFPAVMRAKEMLEEGRLGRILSFRAMYLHSGSVDPCRPIGWKQNSDLAGGVIYDLGSHVLDLLFYLLGEYRDITCKTQIIYPTRPDKQGNMVEIHAEDAAYLLISMKNGAAGTCELTKVATGINDELRMEIHGDKGALHFNIADPEWLWFYDNTLPDCTLGGTKGFTKIECVGRYPSPAGVFPGPKYSIGWLRGHVHSLYSFLDAIDKNKKPSPSFSEGAYVQYVLDKAKSSAQNYITESL